jgi:pseudouridine synthase
VRLNGALLSELSARVDPDRDRVEVDGELVQARPAQRTFVYNKPVGVVCSFTQQGEAPSLRESLPPELFEGRLFHVGRLDRESSGLLLLSDDGDLAHALLHPSHPIWKRYLVLLDRPLDEESIVRFRSGAIVLGQKACAPARIDAVDGDPAARYRIELREGRKRQIRRMVEALGRRVRGLHREAFGPLELGNLAVGEVRPLRETELERLRRAALVHGD